MLTDGALDEVDHQDGGHVGGRLDAQQHVLAQEALERPSVGVGIGVGVDRAGFGAGRQRAQRQGPRCYGLLSN